MDKNGRELSEGEIKKLIREIVSETMKRGLEKQKPKAEKLVIEPPEPSDEDLIY